VFTTLISPELLAEHLHDPDWVAVDCRFSLADTEAGRRAYGESHIPGAAYAHLDEDLSGPPVTDHGRHPLPSPQKLAMLFARLGVGQGVQVAVYDDANGMVAARLWWMLRYMGHTAAAVLDGGWQGWLAAGLPARGGWETIAPRQFTGSPRRSWLALLDEVAAAPLLVDSRAPARYRGQEEPIDPAAGHIPGAVNFFYQRHWGADGRYLPPEKIRENLQALLAGQPAADAVFYCGSGVSACVNLLAMVYAGLGDGRLYAGSWSEWCADPERETAAS